MINWTVRVLLSAGLLAVTGSVNAQFSSTVESKKPKPLITKAEMISDSSDHMDRQSTWKDRKTHEQHTLYTSFDKYKSNSAKDESHIMYLRGDASGKNWTKAVRISKNPGDCLNGDNTLKSNAPCTGSRGQVYACWASPKGVAFQRSLDNGKTWMDEEKIVAPIVNGWDQWVEGLHTNGIPNIAYADTGKFQGRIYITWSDEKNGKKNKDVFLVYSDDEGTSWTEPILVTYRPNHKEQFNPQVSVQPVTGDVYLTYFDRQNYYDGGLSDLFLAVSYNGGLKFYMYQLNEKPIVIDSNVAAVRGLAFPRSREVKAVWSQVDEDNMLGIYSVLMNDSTVAAYVKKHAASQMILPRTVSFDKKVQIDFELKEKCKVTGIITKPLDAGFSKILMKEKEFEAGQNTLFLEPKKLDLPKGNYVLTLYYNNRNSFTWITAD